MMTLFSQERIDQFKYDEAWQGGRAEGIGIGEKRGIGIGKAEGIGIGRYGMLSSLVSQNLLSKDIAAAQLGISVEEFDKRVAKLS